MTKISQLSSIGDSLAVDDQFIIRDVSDVSTPNKSVTVSGITRALDLGTAAAPAIAFASDKNTGIYSPGADQVAISTNGTEYMRLDSSGRLGIGTSAPEDVLHLASGNFRLTNGAAFTTANSLIRSISFFAGSANQFETTRISSFTGAFVNRGEIAFSTGDDSNSCVERVRINYLGNVGIGTTSPSSPLHVYSAGNTEILIGGTSTPILNLIGGAATDPVIGYGVGALRFGTTTGAGAAGFSEKVRIDTSGRLLVGTSTARGNFFNTSYTPQLQLEGVSQQQSMFSLVNSVADNGGPVIALGKQRSGTIGGNTIVNAQDVIGAISFQASDGTELVAAASIDASVDGTPGANDMPGRLVFSTTASGAASPTERMRIAANGRIALGGQGAPYISSTCDTYNNGSGEFAHAFRQDHASGIGIGIGIDGTYLAYFYPNKDLSGAPVGSISQNGSATAYNTTSDYRLKENVVPLAGAIDRVNDLQVRRFNFISNPDKTVDGFIAHEAQAVVPECVTGEKDAVDDDGNPKYQGIDQSKLVPLLTAALQEAIAEIASLKDRVAALEAE